MAQFGRALRSGRRGRVFESRHPDLVGNLDIFKVSDFFCFSIYRAVVYSPNLARSSMETNGDTKNPIFSVPVGFVTIVRKV